MLPRQFDLRLSRLRQRENTKGHPSDSFFGEMQNPEFHDTGFVPHKTPESMARYFQPLVAVEDE